VLVYECLYSVHCLFVCLCLGTIDLEGCVSVVPHTDPIKNYKHVFDVCTRERVYHLSADTHEEKWAWVNTLQELLFPPKVKGAGRKRGREGRGRKGGSKALGVVITSQSPQPVMKKRSSQIWSGKIIMLSKNGPPQPFLWKTRKVSTVDNGFP